MTLDKSERDRSKKNASEKDSEASSVILGNSPGIAGEAHDRVGSQATGMIRIKCPPEIIGQQPQVGIIHNRKVSVDIDRPFVESLEFWGQIVEQLSSCNCRICRSIMSTSWRASGNKHDSTCYRTDPKQSIKLQVHQFTSFSLFRATSELYRYHRMTGAVNKFYWKMQNQTQSVCSMFQKWYLKPNSNERMSSPTSLKLMNRAPAYTSS